MAEGKVERTQKLYKPEVEGKALAEELFKASGIENEGDFLTYVMEFYKFNQIKDSLGAGYQKQISSLEYHAKSIVELFTSMLQTENSDRRQLTEDYEAKITKYTEEISAQQDEVSQLKHNYDDITDQLSKTINDNMELRKYIASMETLNSKNDEILAENKERIERLSKLVSDGQDAIAKRQELESKMNEMLQQSKEQSMTIEKMSIEHKEYSDSVERTKKSMEEQHAVRLKEAKQIVKLEADQAMVDLRRELQDELSTAQKEHAKDLRQLYMDIDSLRQQLSDAKQAAIAAPPQAE